MLQAALSPWLVAVTLPPPPGADGGQGVLSVAPGPLEPGSTFKPLTMAAALAGDATECLISK